MSDISRDVEIVCTPITSTEQFYTLQGQWSNLMEESETYSFFLTWEWLSTWWEVYHGEKTKLLILVFHHKDTLVGLAPFYVDGSKNKKILQFIGMGEPQWEEVASMYLDIICRNGYEKKICKSTWNFLQENKELWDVALFHDIIQPSNILDNMLGVIKESNYNYIKKQVSTRFYIDMPDVWDEYIAQFSKNRRKKIRWNLNRLNSLGDVNEYPVTKENELESGFDELVRLHTMRWEEQGEHGVFACERFLTFHRKLLKKVFLLNRLDLRMLSINGEIVSSLYNFRYNNNIFTYQAGFYLEENFSLGFVADILGLQAAVRCGCQIYDYMKGEEGSYKESFQCKKTPMFSLTIYNRNLNGQLSYLIEKAKDVARPIKRLITSS